MKTNGMPKRCQYCPMHSLSFSRCLTADLPNQEYVGLIGCLGNGGKVQNLTLAEVEINGKKYVGGVVGYNEEGTVTGCYWSNYDGSGSGDVTKVDGTTVTWVDAQRGMNDAIDAWNGSNPDKQCNWHYAETDAETPPTLAENK